MVTTAPLTAWATVMLPMLLAALKVKLLTVEALSVMAVAESFTTTVPPVLADNVAAKVLTVKLVGVPDRAKVVVLARLLTIAVPVVLAVRLVTLLTTLNVAALPARVTELVLAALLT